MDGKCDVKGVYTVHEKKEILMNVYGKKFGKNFISYQVKNLGDNEILLKGKCSDYSTTRKIFRGLTEKYGEEKVLLLHN